MKKAVMVVVAAVISTSAWAEERTGFYLNANLGQATYDISQDDLDEISLAAFEAAGATVLTGDSTFDDSGTAYSLLAGYRFSRYWGIEAGYADLGKATYRSDGTVLPPGSGIPVAATMDLDLSAKGPLAAVIGFLPIGDKFDFHARVGVFFADTTIDITATMDTSAASDSLSANSQDLFVGAGFAYNFTDQLAVTVDYTSFQDVGDEEETGEGSVDSFSAGLIYRF